jgi:hypothetical protein
MRWDFRPVSAQIEATQRSANDLRRTGLNQN